MQRRAEILLLLTTAPRSLDWLAKRFQIGRGSILRDLSILRRKNKILTVQGKDPTYELDEREMT